MKKTRQKEDAIEEIDKKHYQKDECTECYYDVNSGNDLDVSRVNWPVLTKCRVP